jgi:hypothetical protein
VQVTNFTLPEGFTFTVKAMHTNTGIIHVGGSSADALNTGTTSCRLQASQSSEVQTLTTNTVWVDSSVSGEGVEVVMEY